MITIRDGQVVQVPDDVDPADNPDAAYDTLDATWRKAIVEADRFEVTS